MEWTTYDLIRLRRVYGLDGMAIGAIFLIGFAVGIYKGAVKIAVSLAQPFLRLSL